MAEVQSDVSYLRVDTEKFHFVWKLAGFNKIPFLTDHPMTSASFSLNDKSETLWQLSMAKEIRHKFKPKQDTWIFDKDGGMNKVKVENGEEEKLSVATPGEKALGFKMVISDFDVGQTWETVKYHIQIKIGENTVKTEEKVENGEKYYSTSSFHYIFSSDAKGIELFDQETITIEAIIEHKQIDTRPLIPSKMLNQDSFTENLVKLFKSMKYTDVILTAGDCEIPAHKCILSTKSYGLEQHFPETADLPLTKLNLNLEEPVVEALLIFAYCGKIPEDFPIAKFPSLYAAAEKYEVYELKTLVKDRFKDTIGSLLCDSCILKDEIVSDVILGLPEEKVKTVLVKCQHKSKQ